MKLRNTCSRCLFALAAMLVVLLGANPSNATSVGWHPSATNVITVSEGAGGFPDLWVKVYDNEPQEFSCSVDWRITGGTGRLGIDYDVPRYGGLPVTNGTFHFQNVWNPEAVINQGPDPIPPYTYGRWWTDSYRSLGSNFISIVNDNTVEGGFTIELTLENATGCPLNPAIQRTITLTVVDNDAILYWDEWDARNVLSVEEGGKATLSVHMEPALSIPVTVALSTRGTLPAAATVGQDYAFWPTPSLSWFTIPPGGTNVTVWVQTVDDAQGEQDETFEVSMSTSSGPQIWGSSNRVVRILDDDPWASISFVTNRYQFSEADGAVSIEVRLSQPAGRDVWAWLDYSEGTAHFVSDYTLRPTDDPDSPAFNKILIPAGATSAFFDFVPKTDSLFEGNSEQATLRLVNMVGCSRGTFTSCTITLQDDTPAPTASAVTNRVDVQENLGFALVPVRLTHRAAMDTAIRYAVTGGSATGGGVDYTLDSGTLIIPAYTSEANLEVPITNDSSDETNETFAITFSSGTLGQGGWPVQVVGANNTVVTILDQDTQPSLRFYPFFPLNAGDPGSFGSSEVSEGNSVALEVVLSRASGQTVTVSFGTFNVTATNTDYSVSPQTLQFNPGDLTKTLTVTAAADSLAEGDELFLLTLQNATNATLGRSTLQVLIRDGDGVAVEPEPSTVVGRASGHKVRCRKAAVPGAPLGDIGAAEALLALRLPNDNVAFEVSDTGVPVINYTDTATNPPPQGAFPSDRDFHQIAGSPTFAAGDIDDLALSASGYLYIPTEGNWSFSVRSDEGFRLRMGTGRTIVSECVGQREPSNSVAIVSIPRPGYYAYELTYFDHAGGAQIEFAATPPPFRFGHVQLADTDQLVGAPRPWGDYSEWSEIDVYQDVVDSPLVLYSNTLVAAGDTTLHGRSVILEAGATLTLSGVHHLRDLCVAGTITHERGDTNGVSLVVDGLLEITADGKIDVTGKGYRGGYSDGWTALNAETNAFGDCSWGMLSGGSYGSLGVGLEADSRVNALYGEPEAPVWLGSGGTSRAGNAAGNGGGRINIEAGAMVVDGQLLADGQAGDVSSYWTASGSGGSIWLRLTGGEFSGSGTIHTAGGSNGSGSARGGMGRIAITGYGSYGFVGSIGYAGTLFRQQADTGGDLMLDTTTLVIPLGVTKTYASLSSGAGASVITNRGILTLTENTLTVPARVTLFQDGTVCGVGRTDGVIGALTVASNAVMTHTRGNTNGLQLRVAGLLRVETGGLLDVTAKGYRGGYRDGWTALNAETNAFGDCSQGVLSGGSYGSLGVGLDAESRVNALYGDAKAPAWLGSGGTSRSGNAAGNGGGRIDIEAGAVVVDGQLLADGQAGDYSDYWAASGSGGSIWLRLNGGAFSGSGTIRTAGGLIGSARGGMGRIAVTGYGTNLFAGAIGCAGTLFRQQAGTSGDLMLDTTTLVIPPGVTNTYASLSSGAGASVITNRGILALTENVLTVPARVTLFQDGTVCGSGRTDGVIGALTVASNAVMTHTRGNTNGLQLRVAGLFRVEAGGLLDVSAKGYRGGCRDGWTALNAETNAFGDCSRGVLSGGSYGSPGAGLDAESRVNALYGSPEAPVWLGSGGSSRSGNSAGNGGGRIDIEAGAVVVDGQLLADGQAGDYSDYWAASGSGGSIWLRLTGGEFSGSGTIRTAGGLIGSARGGMGRIAVTGYGTNLFTGVLGFAGTLFRQQAGKGGDLTLDATTLVIPPGVTNTYASLSSGAGASVITNCGTLALTTDTLTVPARVTLFQEGTICGTGRLDRAIGALTVASNAIVTHTRGNTNGVQLRVAGLFRVEAGGLIDVTAKGYRGGYRDGWTSLNAETNAFGDFSRGTLSGGSYGGLGVSLEGSVNALYGSSEAPVWLGSGGTSRAGNAAGNGGGRIDIEAGAVVVDGQLLADGQAGADSSYWTGSGSGGSIWLRLTGGTFSASGIIRAQGGSNGDGSARGGGGRIAVTGYATATSTGVLYAGNGSLYWEPDIPLDSDGDGLPDIEETARGTNPTLRDTDGDGASDGNEVAAGTDPLNRASLLTFIALTPAVDGLNVTWQGGTQVTQLLQRISCLNPLTIQSVYTNLPPMTLTNTYFDIKGTNTMLFYRLQILR